MALWRDSFAMESPAFRNSALQTRAAARPSGALSARPILARKCREVELMVMVDGARGSAAVRCFEKKRPGRHVPWRRPAGWIWRDRIRLLNS